MRLTIGDVVEFNGLKRTVIRLGNGEPAIPWTVRCYRPGCQRRKSGYLTQGCGNGAFYNRRGDFLADLREVDFACPEHCKSVAGIRMPQGAEKNLAESERANALIADRKRIALKGQMTRLHKRIAGGVCPCCHRTFQNLARHMAGEHPDFQEQPTADEVITA